MVVRTSTIAMTVAVLAASSSAPADGAAVKNVRSAAMVCADRHINREEPGTPVHLRVHMGGVAASLRGRVGHGNPGTQTVVRHASVMVIDAGASHGLQVPRFFKGKGGGPVINRIGSREVHGYLCLIRFQPTDPPVGVVGVNPTFMGGGPRLRFLSTQTEQLGKLRADFRRWDLRRPQHKPIVRTGDLRFFAIGGFDADSGDPLAFYTVRGGHLVNISARHHRAIRADAERWLHQFRHPRHGPYLGAIASWAADKCTLGHQDHALSKLDRLQAAGRFHRYTALRHGHFRHVSFAHHVKRFLARTGYAH
jgi:hypothetical protein